MGLKTSQSDILWVEKEPLRKHSYFGIGGEADYYAEPQNLERLLATIAICKKKNLKYQVVGAGANILYSDQGYRGCIISMTGFEKNFFEVSGNTVKASASMRTSSFVRLCDEAGLSGMEFLSFIPGTIGGTLAMNAGCINYSTNRYDEISQFVKSVTVLVEGEVREISKKDITFRYRQSSLRESIVLFGTFELTGEKLTNFKEELKHNYRERAKKMPMNRPSLGSIFKNPKGHEASAGKLIDILGLKGYQVGGVRITEQHGNVFENMGSGTAKDTWNLIKHVQDEVKKKFDIDLELEIEYIE